MKVAAYVASVRLSEGLGSVENPCTIGAINVALNGVLTDDPTCCMSPTLTEFVIEIQDSISSYVRNSPEWREIIPLLLNTRDQETEIEQHVLELRWVVLEAVGIKTAAGKVANLDFIEELTETIRPLVPAVSLPRIKNFNEVSFSNVIFYVELILKFRDQNRHHFWDSLNAPALVRQVLKLPITIPAPELVTA
jgi:hypothetical protein